MANEKENRVLGRKGARVVNEQELDRINGGVHTETVCTFGPKGLDGDVSLGEC